MALSKEQIRNLRVGQNLKLTAHFPGHDSYLDAKVTVLTFGNVACWIQVTEILERGPKNMTIEGDECAALFSELDALDS